MKKNPALRLIAVAIIIILLLVGYYSAGSSSIDEIRTWDIKGVVQQVSRSMTSNTPVVTVNGKEYDLTGLHTKQGINITKGDTIFKAKGDTVIKLIKPNTKDTIYCNNP